jgi:Shikimate kinase
MIVLIFGISNVGKTSIGRKLAMNLEYDFRDLDDEIKRTFGTTLEGFMEIYPWLHERFKVKGEILKSLIERSQSKTVIAVSPIFYARNFNRLLDLDNVIAIELQDSKENIFERLVFSDENDNVYTDDEYRNARKDRYLKRIQEDIVYVRNTFKKVKNKYFIANRSIEDVANDLAELVPKLIVQKFQ